MRHVGDVDAHLHITVVEHAVREGVVEILGIGRVDGKRGHAAEIPAAGQVFRRDVFGYFVGRLLHFRFETVGKLVFGQDGVHLRIVLARDAEHVDDPAQRFGAPLRPVGHQHGDFHPMGSLLAADLRQLRRTGHVDTDVIRHILAFDDGPDLPAADHQDADVRLGAATDDLDHFAFQAASFRTGLDPVFRHRNLHEIAVQGEMQLAHRDEDVFRPSFYLYEAKPVAREGDRTFEFLQRFAPSFRRPHQRCLLAACQPLCTLECTFPDGIFTLFPLFAIRCCHIFRIFARLLR